MSIKKSTRPSLRIKTFSSSATASPTLTQGSSSTKVGAGSDIYEEKSDEEMADYAPSRPLSVAIPRSSEFSSTGPYCPRRPNLSDILANNSPPPWTLSAFMAYLSQNHCLETLEFTMDASRYRKHHTKLTSRSPGGALAPGSSESAYALSLWQKLLEAYIVPNGPREVNIPSDVRDQLVSFYTSEVAPDPSVLDVAVQKVYELMEESVLVPFLNSFYPQTAHPYSRDASQEDVSYSASYDERGHYRRTTRKERISSPGFMSLSLPSSAPAIQNRSSAPSGFSQFARTLSHSARHASNSSTARNSHPTSARSSSTAVISPWSSNQSDVIMSPAELSAGLTDDTSASSPSAMGEPMTPPTTPPQCDFGSTSSSNAGFAGSNGVSTWKKMRSSFTFKKKKSGSLREEEIDSHGNYV